MQFKLVHENYNVRDLEISLAFYQKALGLKEKRRNVAADGSFIIAFLGNDHSGFCQEELFYYRKYFKV